jgi:hypothetical protein
MVNVQIPTDEPSVPEITVRSKDVETISVASTNYRNLLRANSFPRHLPVADSTPRRRDSALKSQKAPLYPTKPESATIRRNHSHHHSSEWVTSNPSRSDPEASIVTAPEVPLALHEQIKPIQWVMAVVLGVFVAAILAAVSHFFSTDDVPLNWQSHRELPQLIRR